VNAPFSTPLFKQSAMTCRHCGSPLSLDLIDLGFAPPSNAYLAAKALKEPEIHYPLRVLVCQVCWLTQTEDFVGHDQLFTSDYAYFSSCSVSWVEHARTYVDAMVARFGLNARSTVVEIGSNDGYLLQHVSHRGIPNYGIEPTASTAAAARAKGLFIVEEFFSRAVARRMVREKGPTDLMIANNVMPHVPDINDFVAGFVIMLKDNGVATFEFPHFYNLVRFNQFDTIYHEHYSYPSLSSVVAIFVSNGLEIFDVEEIKTHGGSLRVYAQRQDTRRHPVSSRVQAILEKEEKAGMKTVAFYKNFQDAANKAAFDLLLFLIECNRAGKTIVGYGAAAKGNTLLNYAGVKPNLLPRVYDAAPSKAGKYLPGSHIPILPASEFTKESTDYVLILPWNISEEIKGLYPEVRQRGGKWVTAIPSLKVHD
jgi:hypothetical protein